MLLMMVQVREMTTVFVALTVRRSSPIQREQVSKQSVA